MISSMLRSRGQALHTLVGVSPYDPLTMTVEPSLLMVIARLACSIPARRRCTSIRPSRCDTSDPRHQCHSEATDRSPFLNPNAAFPVSSCDVCGHVGREPKPTPSEKQDKAA